eukprot:2906742-Prymnesium_polylepis.1
MKSRRRREVAAPEPPVQRRARARTGRGSPVEGVDPVAGVAALGGHAAGEVFGGFFGGAGVEDGGGGGGGGAEVGGEEGPGDGGVDGGNGRVELEGGDDDIIDFGEAFGGVDAGAGFGVGGVGKGVAEGVVALVAEGRGAAGGGVIGVKEDEPGGVVELDGAVRR